MTRFAEIAARRGFKWMAGGLALAILSLLALEFSGARESLVPGEARIQRELRDLKQAQTQLQKELNEAAALKHRRELFSAQSKDYWIPARDGKAETEMQKVINGAAKLAGTKLSSLGDIRQTKISDGIFLMELSIGAGDSMESLSRFMAEIYRSSPRLHWQKYQFRPDATKNSRNVNFSGSLGFLCISDERTSKFLLAEKGAAK